MRLVYLLAASTRFIRFQLTGCQERRKKSKKLFSQTVRNRYVDF